MPGKLYICATPIGNLGDITLRVLETLENVDLIAAEDTRHSLKLLQHFNIKTPLTSYYEHNKKMKGNFLIEELTLKNKNIALISDAGMPLISDPGDDLIRLCIENNVEMEVLPGASALTTALVVSGLPTGRFAFEGFLTMNKRNRANHLQEIKNDTRTLIFYEAPHKLLSTLKDMREVLGNREIVLARELTKKFEEIIRTDLEKAIEKYSETSPKGEYVLLLSGKSEDELEAERKQALPSPKELLKQYLDQGLTGKDAISNTSKVLKLPKKEVYSLYLREFKVYTQTQSKV